MTVPLVQASLALALVALVGASLPLLRRWSERGLHITVSAAAGFFLGAIFLHLLPELATATSGRTPWIAALLGLVVMFFLENIWLVGWRRRADRHDVVWFASFIGLSVHAFVTGLGYGGVVADPRLAWTFVGSIAVHKAGEAFSLASLMRLARLERRRALGGIVLFALATPIGLLVGARLATDDQVGTVSPLLTGLACGTFLYVAVADLLPEVFHGEADRWLRVLGLLVGIGVAASGLAHLS
jgi:zinc transporter ZupT